MIESEEISNEAMFFHLALQALQSSDGTDENFLKLSHEKKKITEEAPPQKADPPLASPAVLSQYDHEPESEPEPLEKVVMATKKVNPQILKLRIPNQHNNSLRSLTVETPKMGIICEEGVFPSRNRSKNITCSAIPYQNDVNPLEAQVKKSESVDAESTAKPPPNNTKSRRWSVDSGNMKTSTTSINSSRKGSWASSIHNLSKKISGVLGISTNSSNNLLNVNPPVVSSKFLFSVSTTSTKKGWEVADEVIRVLKTKPELTYSQNGYIFKIKIKNEPCGKTVLALNLSICGLEGLSIVGIRLSRIKGDTWTFKEICHDILSDLSL
eukprot:Sdes_comp10407_c0_seq1m2068